MPGFINWGQHWIPGLARGWHGAWHETRFMNVWHSAGPGQTWPAAEAGASTVLYDRSPFLFAKMAAIIDIDEEIEEDFWL